MTLESYFSKKVDVFGVLIFATAAAPDEKVLHAAAVMADYLDRSVSTTLRHPGAAFSEPRLVSGGS